MGKLSLAGKVPELITNFLPSGYTKLAYIQSSGEQYIDTGFKPNQDTRIVLRYGGCIENQWREVFGSGESVKVPKNNFIVVQSTANGVMAQIGSEYFTGALTSDGAHIEINRNQFYINGALVHTFTYSAFVAPYTLRLFDATTKSEDYSLYSGKIYSCQIYDNDTLVRDFVPCVTDDGEIGLYDLVEKTFYGNAGTGVFLGSEVA